jgi:hypothetical protein
VGENVRLRCEAAGVGTVLLGVIALALAWTTFRIERFTARQRQIEGAHALLTAVRQAVVSRDQDGEPQLGWGQIYSSNIYVPGFKYLKEIGERAIQQARMGRFDQVLVVPTEPLEKLATTDAGGDLISAETVAAANHVSGAFTSSTSSSISRPSSTQ